jgi:hypothetical protein
MKYALGNMLNGTGGLNADQLALDLQLAADKTLTARKGPTPVLTRGSSATFVGSNGLIQSAGNNVARFDHDPVTLESRGLLIEEGRTNQSLRSGALVLLNGWVATEATLSASGTGPDGNTSYIASETSSTNTHNFLNTGSTTNTFATSVTSGTVYTGSIFLKNVTGSVDWIQLTFHGPGFGTGQYANFNIVNGTVGNSAGLASGTSPRIENYGNGWYRCSMSAAATATTSTTGNLLVAFINNTNGTTRAPSYAGSTSNSVLASLCQFEAGSFATSYIPTTTSALARSADVCSITGANFTGMYNPLEGSLFTSAIFNAPVAYGAAQSVVDINDTTAANRLRIIRNGNNAFMSFSNTSASSQNVSITTATAQQPFSVSKSSAGFKVNDYVYYLNNSQVGEDTLGAMIVSPTTFTIGDFSAAVGTRPINGTISAIRYYKKRLDNSKLASLTV